MRIDQRNTSLKNTQVNVPNKTRLIRKSTSSYLLFGKIMLWRIIFTHMACKLSSPLSNLYQRSK